MQNRWAGQGDNWNREYVHKKVGWEEVGKEKVGRETIEIGNVCTKGWVGKHSQTQQ